MNPALSPLIYSQLINGNVINKDIYTNGIMEPCPLFTDVFSSLEAYRNSYRMIGYELITMGDGYFLRDLSQQGLYRDAAMKIQVLLEVLARGMAGIPLHAEALLSHTDGLPREDVLSIGADEDIQVILKACGMPGGIEKEVENNLVRRGIGFWNMADNLVLTSTGIAMFDELFSVEVSAGS